MQVYKSTKREKKKRNITRKRVLFSDLLQNNNATAFQELLAQHPEYIQMRCSSDNNQVSF